MNLLSVGGNNLIAQMHPETGCRSDGALRSGPVQSPGSTAFLLFLAAAIVGGIHWAPCLSAANDETACREKPRDAGQTNASGSPAAVAADNDNEAAAILDGLHQTEKAIRNLSVTTDYVKRQMFLLPVDKPVEMTLVTKAVIDHEGRSHEDTDGQRGDVDSNGKTLSLHRGRWIGTDNGKSVRRLDYWHGNNWSRATHEDAFTWHGIDPREFTTHFRGRVVSDIVRQPGSRIAGRTTRNGRAVVVVETAPFGPAEPRRHRFWIDPERRIVVRRALEIHFTEGQPWQEYIRLEGRDHREVSPGIWLPTRITHECVRVTPELRPEELHWRYEGTNRDWRVNRELPADTFELNFPAGIEVVDYRHPPQRRDATERAAAGKIDPQRLAEIAVDLKDFQKRHRALEDLAKLIPAKSDGRTDFGPVLEPLLKFSGWGGIGRNDSRHAEDLIVRIGPSAMPFLKERLKSKDERERRVAVQVLVRIDSLDAGLAPLLRPLLADKEDYVRRAAIDGLGSIGPLASDAVPDLEKLAASAPNVFHRAVARVALIRIAGATEDRIRDLADLLELQEPNDGTAGYAAWELSQLGVKARAAEPQLLAALKHPRLRGSAAHALGAIGADSPDTIAALINLLENGAERENRRSAAGALGAIGPKAKAAVPGLVAALNDDDKGGWWIAVDALGKIGGSEVLPILIGALECPNDGIRHASVKSLGALGAVATKAIVPLELSREQDPRDYIRTAAARALQKIEQAVSNLPKPD